MRTMSGPGVIVVVLAFVAVSTVAMAAPVSTVERTVFSVVNQLPPGMGRILLPVMQGGTLLAAPLIAVVASVRRHHVLALQLLVAGPAAWLVARGLKILVQRPRPPALLGDVVVRGGPFPGLGYPSGHAAVAAAVAAVLAAELPARWGPVAWGVAVLVCLGRMYVGAHLPLDVIGGALLGVAVGRAARALLAGPGTGLDAGKPSASRVRGFQ